MVARWPYNWRHEKDGGVRAILKSDKLKAFESAKSWWATVEEIRKADYRLTAGQYCKHKAVAVEHEKPEVLINRLLDLEEEITSELQDLMTLVSVPSTAQSLKGSMRLVTDSTE
jgi:hypothetical protein